MQKALRKTFGVPPLGAAAAGDPTYWRDRFSGSGLSIEGPDATTDVAGRGAVGEWPGSPLSRHLLVKHQGRAASFLAGRPA